MNFKLRMTAAENERFNELMAICRLRQGEFGRGAGGRQGWSCYGSDFIKAASELYLLIMQADKDPPKDWQAATGYRQIQIVCDLLSKEFIVHDVRSCRGGQMTAKSVDYLRDKYLRDHISKVTTLSANLLERAWA